MPTKCFIVKEDRFQTCFCTGTSDSFNKNAKATFLLDDVKDQLKCE